MDLLNKSFRWLLVLSLFMGPMALVLAATGDQDQDLSKDPHFREELGVNQYTAPSIESLFQTLDSLKPIPYQQLSRTPQALRINNRVKFALSFGVLIGDGFLAVSGEDSKNIEPLGRELLRRAKGLGVEQRVTRHSKLLLDLARQSKWGALRKELIVTQQDVELAMLDLRDEEIAHLLSLGGWIRGLEIAAASVATTFTQERAEKLRQLDLMDYYLGRLGDLSPSLKATPWMINIVHGLTAIRQELSSEQPLTKEDSASIQATAHEMVEVIEAP